MGKKSKKEPEFTLPHPCMLTKYYTSKRISNASYHILRATSFHKEYLTICAKHKSRPKRKDYVNGIIFNMVRKEGVKQFD